MDTTAASRSVAKVTRAQPRTFTPQVRVDNLTGYQMQLDPFLGIDRFSMRAPRSPPHPHAGFCALTYLFDDSDGGLVSRDSLGHTSVVRPGDLCWTTAGRGIVHEEVPSHADRFASGLQVFVNLPSDMKRMPPCVRHLDTSSVALWRGDRGARARVLVGRTGDVESPLVPPVPITLLDVTLPAGVRFVHRLPRDEIAVAWVLAGNGAFGRSNRVVRRRDACSFAHDGERVEMRAGRSGMRVAIFAGRPLGEPVVARGPFIMSSDEELDEAYLDFRLGRMGKLAASF